MFQNWKLISGLFAAFVQFERKHGWSLSIGENAKLAESLYVNLENNLPQNKEQLLTVLERAFVFTWGADHKCGPVSNIEMITLLYSIESAFDVNMTKHIKQLNLGG
jgi:hypothetical protein